MFWKSVNVVFTYTQKKSLYNKLIFFSFEISEKCHEVRMFMRKVNLRKIL